MQSVYRANQLRGVQSVTVKMVQSSCVVLRICFPLLTLLSIACTPHPEANTAGSSSSPACSWQFFVRVHQSNDPLILFPGGDATVYKDSDSSAIDDLHHGGTLRWTAAELLDGKTPFVQSDMWAFGMTTLVCLAGFQLSKLNPI